MTDEVKTEETTEQTSPQMSLEQIALIRKSILEMAQKNYKAFIKSLREIPIHPQACHQAFLFMDTGMLWMKEAIEYAPLIQAPSSEPTSEKPEENVH